MVRHDKAPLISIICPVTRVQEREADLSQWVSKLDYNKAELLFVHDVNENETGQELLGYLEKLDAKNIHIQIGKYGSAGAARNAALEICQGEWVCFWDSDDLPVIESVFSALSSNKDVIVGEYLKRSQVDGASIRKRLDSNRDLQNQLSIDPGLWRMVFRRSILNGIEFPEITMGEDQDFLAQLNWDKISVEIVNEVFYEYKHNLPNQTTSKVNSRISLLNSIEYLMSLKPHGSIQKRFISNLIARQSLTLAKSREVTTLQIAANIFFRRNNLNEASRLSIACSFVRVIILLMNKKPAV